MFNMEIIGLLAACIVAFSFLLKGEFMLRLVNSIGSIFFVIYGIGIHAWSVALLNGLVIIVNIIKFYKYKNKVLTSDKL